MCWECVNCASLNKRSTSNLLALSISISLSIPVTITIKYNTRNTAKSFGGKLLIKVRNNSSRTDEGGSWMHQGINFIAAMITTMKI